MAATLGLTGPTVSRALKTARYRLVVAAETAFELLLARLPSRPGE
jgi:hypothetical protein